MGPVYRGEEVLLPSLVPPLSDTLVDCLLSCSTRAPSPAGMGVDGMFGS